MSWLDELLRLRAAGLPSVMVTVSAVRGHAPREAGTKMVVSEDSLSNTIGGGNLEMVAINRARQMLREGINKPETLSLRLNDKQHSRYGRQCCGGEVSILLEPMPAPPVVAIFGMGHVGQELARILARHEMELYVSDSRPEKVESLDFLQPALARIHPVPALLGEELIGTLPAGAHVLIMTHDHAEDFHLCDAALRRDDLGSVGLIGSSAKWRRFEKNLAATGHAPEKVAQINCPIGIPELGGKHPATIAVSVAAALLQNFTAQPSAAPKEADDEHCKSNPREPAST